MSYTANIIPGWKVVPFGKLVRRSQYGLSEPSTPEGVPYLKMSNIRDGKVILEGADTLEVNEATLSDYALKRGDLVFNRTNSLDLVGKMGVFHSDSPAIFASYLIRFQLHEEKADSRFVAAWFETSGAKHRLRCIATPGVSQSNINPTTLRAAMMVPRPPIYEQRKIADILSTWNEALETLDALIATKTRQKQALMQQLLTGKTRVKGAKGKWKKIRMGEVLERVFRPIEWHADLPLNLVSLRRRCGGLFRRPDVKGSEYKTQDLHEIRAGDFLISKRQVVHGAWGYVTSEFEGGHVSKEYAILDNLAPDKLHMPFFAWLAQTRRLIRLARVSSTGVHIEKLIFDPDVFLRESIRIPADLAEQQQIAAILDTADQELTLLRTQRQTLDQQKRGLMQRLLTGKTRVTP